MRILRAEYAGSCFGVQRALDMAEEAAAEGATAQTIGPLIHNPLVVARLEGRGVTVAKSPDQATAHTVIIRSHGVVPRVRHQLDALGKDVRDATCPHVLRAQRAAAALAESCDCVIVVGDAKHPEVEGLRAYAEEAGGCVHVVSDAAELPDELPERIGVVVQTTSRAEVLDDVVHALRERGAQLDVKNTICSATTKRQEAAAKLAGTVDAMVVIGGHNSSNTTRLFEICSAACPRAFHIESADELQRSQFSGCETVGVTAGASTPEYQITEVVRYLEGL